MFDESYHEFLLDGVGDDEVLGVRDRGCRVFLVYQSVYVDVILHGEICEFADVFV